MKKRTLTYFSMALLGLLFGVQSFAQTNVNHPFNNGPQSFTLNPAAGVCFFNYYDAGGPTANYPNGSHNNVNNIVTFNPSNAATHQVKVVFSTFSTEATWDALYVFNGPTVADPIFASANGAPTGAPNPWGTGGWWGAAAPTSPGQPAGTVLATGPTGALTFAFDSDASVSSAGWAAMVSQQAIGAGGPCALTAPANINAITCDVTTLTPTFSPAGCQAGFGLAYSVDGGAPVPLNPIPVSVVIPNLLPGAHTITWTLTDPLCPNIIAGTANQTINVVDQTPPVIICPANIVQTLPAGECFAFINYEVTATDDCPFSGPSGTVSTITAGGNGGAVGGMVYFEVNNTSGQILTITQFGMNISAATSVNIFRKAGTYLGFQANAAAWTLGGTADATVGPFSGAFPGNGTITPAIVNGTLTVPAGVTAFALGTPNAAHNYTNGTGANQTFSDANLTINLGSASNTPFGGTFNPRVFNGSVTYQTPSVSAEPIQTAGLPSGSAFPVGTTTNTFTITDLAGNSANCSFNVTINPFPNVTNTLACNDNVQISLDEDCISTIGADQILEGGPYGCYDTRYVVNLLSAGTGAMLPGVVTASHIGQTINVKVTDTQTGQSCWGSITVEDKLAPELECRDLVIDCTDNPLDPSILEPAPASNGPTAIIYDGLNDPLDLPGGQFIEQNYFFDFGLPAGTPTSDVNVIIDLTHAFTGDVNVDVFAPDGTMATAFAVTGCGGQFPIDCKFDDQGLAGVDCFDLDQDGGTLQCLNNPGQFNPTAMAAFNGKEASGVWRIRIWDDFPILDGGTIFKVGLEIDYSLAQVAVTDNCSNVLTVANGGLTFVDNFTAGACGGNSGKITRQWTATDGAGNSATCTQMITFRRPSLNDVVTPQDIEWTCVQYDVFPNIIEPTALHPYITDTDVSTASINVNLDPNCDDADGNNQDVATTNSTNIANGGGGCPGSFFPNNGLDDADVLALTGSGIPTVDGKPLVDICGIGYQHVDVTVPVCAGTFKIVRKWTIIDWCTNPVDVREFNQVIKVVDNQGPIIDLFSVDGTTESNYGSSEVPALGNGGGCNQEPQFSGGTTFNAHVQLPTGITPTQYNNVVLKSVYLNIQHERVGDLDIFLKSPLGAVLELSSNNGGTGQAYYNTIFNDGAATNITANFAPFNGSFRPEGSLATSCGGFGGNITTLAAFDNPAQPWQNDVLGNWELIIFDEQAPATGKLVGWTLVFDYASLNVDVYNASTPGTGGPHAVCQGTAVVPTIGDITDNCSGLATYVTEIYSINPLTGAAQNLLGTIPTNGGAFNNIPLYINGAPAMYIVRYYVTDGCGNQSSVETKITLRDKVPPVAVCDEITEVSVTNNGPGVGSSCSTLHAESLDDGSYDNCRPVYFLIAKMDDSFSPNIFNRCYYKTRDFCCSDIGDNTVIVLVLDGDPTPFFSNLNSPTLGCDGTPGLFLSPSFTALNYNTCMVTVQVTDKIPPILVSCPANERRSCDWYAANLETQITALGTNSAAKCALLTTLGFGAPTFYDNCAVNVTCNYSQNIDQCLEGTITRSWTATDNAGNNGLQSCNQTIFIDHVSDWVVEFPADITVQCGTAAPDFGEPEIFYETCELVAVSHTDELFTVVADACYKIVRQWTVINWCVVGNEIDNEVIEQPENQLGLIFPQCDLDGDGDCDNRTFRDSWRSGAPANLVRPSAADATRATVPDTDLDSDPWDGYITYQQVIKVNDSVDPVFTNGCQIPDVCILDNTCGATVVLPTPDVDDCSNNVTITAQIRIGGVWLSGFGPYFNVSPGTYEVIYKAIDNCNNQTQCTSTVIVKDCKKPTPYCKNGLVIELMNTVPAMVDIWANDFDAGSFDNCPGTLKISFSADVNDIGNTYDCDDLGQQPVQIWITDAAGNQDYCETFVIIQANMGQCTDDPQVAGTIANEAGAGVDGVEVDINAAGGTFTSNTTTNAAGLYDFNVPAGGDYTISPVLDVNPLNGVSTFDLVLISKHILGVELLNSPYKIIAADANKSNSVTTFDLVEIRKLILFINTDFPNNTSWRFVDGAYSFPNPANPFAATFPEVVNINDIVSPMMNNNFKAIKVGDVNGNAATSFAGNTEDRNMVGDLVLNTDDMEVVEGETYTVNFKATDFNVSGYQFTLNFDKKALKFENVVAGLADAANFGTTMVNDGVLTASWNSDAAKQLIAGDVVFGLTFKATSNGRLSDLLNINSRYTAAEAYTADAQLLNVALSFNNTTVANGFDLYQNTPNPFAGVTTIGFYLPEATSATLTISDVQGKVVKIINRDFAKGYNQETIKRSDLGATGVLYYRLDTGADSATRKMILVD